jgi:hypothetical protein
MGNVAQPQGAENAARIRIRSLWANRSGNSCYGLIATTNYEIEENHEETDNSVRRSR